MHFAQIGYWTVTVYLFFSANADIQQSWSFLYEHLFEINLILENENSYFFPVVLLPNTCNIIYIKKARKHTTSYDMGF